VAQLMRVRHKMYNAQLDYIAEQERSGKAFIVCPDETLGIGRIEQDETKMRNVYEAGRRKAEEMLPQLLEFLDGK
ncbi:MAG: patatin family protein, partial [Bacteroidaceae bacterium]|nr:patatin family protein [Bacteroidaceae bacterium]